MRSRLHPDSRHHLKILVLLLLLVPAQVFAQRDLTRYVNPFVGTGGHGHTFPGAIVPFGMVQLSPDTRLTGWDGCSGYHYSDSIIYGFSHTHLSGTGISDYGDVLLMPAVGERRNNYTSRFSHQNEKASPGYYSVRLDDGNIFVELTATARAGLHRYTFPSTGDANVILDLAHRDKVLDSDLKVTGSTTVIGWRRSQAWARDQIVYFAIEFSQPFKKHEFDELRASFSFDARNSKPILVRVGISAVSTEGALRNLRAEIDHWDFDRVRSDAVAAWNRELSKITVGGGTDTELTNFYTSLYHAMTAPNIFMDVDGRYRGRDFKIQKATDFTNYTVFSLWDTFRAAHPLYTIIDTKRTRDFINTFLAQYEQGGRLPVWELAANETDTMIGYHAVSVIADAAAKGIGGFDLKKAFAAMKHSAELRHHGLGSYSDNGFISTEDQRESVSKVLEYAYDDWCIAEVARMLGETVDYRRYLARAQRYKNVFDPRTGFMRPRTNGGWTEPFDPREVTFHFTEANAWQYTFFVPQDVSGLINRMGGPEKFTAKLDQMFEAESKTTGREQADITGLIGQYAHGNEPSHHIAYLYNYAGQPWKTQRRVRQIMDQFYQPTPDGLIGNEDCGQMSAWYVLSAAGFYPVTPGSTTYAIGTPLFPEVRFNLENGKSFTIKAPGVSTRNIYIQSATLDGKPYRRSYLDHTHLMAGGELVFRMGPRPNTRWGTGPGNEPVSRISARAIVPVPVIAGTGQTFKNNLTIDMQSIERAAAIHYTTDGSEPTDRSPKFEKPFAIGKTMTVKAIAIDRGRQSRAATAKFHQIPHDWKLTLNSRYSSQYTGGGEAALIDGIRGTTNWTSGAWQGYWGKDLVAVVDLGTPQSITRLGAGFLQEAGSWIWMPRSVSFELSLDGQNFVPVLSIPNDVPDGSNPELNVGTLAKDFVKNITRQEARYVRIRAVNFGEIPAWHPGHGGQAWIFVDEIIIE
jgi:predicted alpha-1,2-mannosidase